LFGKTLQIQFIPSEKDRGTSEAVLILDKREPVQLFVELHQEKFVHRAIEWVKINGGLPPMDAASLL
jgi:hypothetical protein